MGHPDDALRPSEIGPLGVHISIHPPLFFSSDPAKVLILNNLWVWDRMGSGQNIDLEGLAAKIFRDKDLASDFADRDP
jgi:hypothetical protein